MRRVAVYVSVTRQHEAMIPDPPQRTIPLSEWAEHEGVSLRSAQRMFHRGSIPYPTRVDQQGHFLVTVPTTKFPETPPSELAEVKRRLARIEGKLDELLSLREKR
jgi:hypothetical protein